MILPKLTLPDLRYLPKHTVKMLALLYFSGFLSVAAIFPYTSEPWLMMLIYFAGMLGIQKFAYSLGKLVAAREIEAMMETEFLRRLQLQKVPFWISADIELRSKSYTITPNIRKNNDGHA